MTSVCLYLFEIWAPSQISLINHRHQTLPSHFSSILATLETLEDLLPKVWEVSFSHWWESNIIPNYCILKTFVMPMLKCWWPKSLLAWIWCSVSWNPISSRHRGVIWGLIHMRNRNLVSVLIGSSSSFSLGFLVLFRKLASNWFCQF